ncbi:MAG: hypothetical protein Q7T69_16830 [Rhodoferax sp.]|nr:hypothetical protein [Rhodoferax sp.]
MSIHFGQLDTQAQDFSAKGRIIDFLQDLRQGVCVYWAGICPSELVAGQEVCTKRVEYFMQCIAVQTQLFVHREPIEQRELGVVHIAIGNDGQGNNSCGCLRAVLGVFAHLIFLMFQ